MDVAVYTDEAGPRRGAPWAPRLQAARALDDKELPQRTTPLPRHLFQPLPRVWYHGGLARRTRTASGSYTAARTTRSRSPASGLAPARSRAPSAAHPAVSEAAVIGVPDDVKGTALVGFVTFKPGRSATGDELVALVARRLGKPLAPREVHPLPAIPKTRSGRSCAAP